MTENSGASRELRARVARIMGCPMEGDNGIVRYCRCDYEETKGDPLHDRAWCPKFDKEPAACKLVKNWLREQSIWFMIDFVADGNVEVVYGGRQDLWSEAPTEELAVCRFVLALRETGEL